MVNFTLLKPKEDKDTEEKILQLIKSRNILSKDEVDLVAKEKEKTAQRVEEILYNFFPRKEEQFERVLSDSALVPIVHLKTYPVNKALLKKLPQEFADRFKIVVFEHLGDKIYKVASCWPTHPAVWNLIKFIEEKNRVDLELYGTTMSEIKSLLDQYPQEEEVTEPKIISQMVTGKMEATLTDATQKEALSSLQKLLARQPRTEQELKSILESGFVPQMIAAIISFGIFKKASDIHLQPLNKRILVRYRIDGVLSDIAEIKKEFASALVSRVKILANLRIDEKRKPQDGRLSVEFDNKKIDLRISTMPTVYGEKVVMRILEKEKKLMDLRTLGMEGLAYQQMVENVKKPYGMVIVSGPTGSGKSTTLYAALTMIHSPEVNIVSIEDPVEYEIEGIAQSQIKPQAGFTFASGLRSILRQDPDIIMVGEIRDKETAEMAVHAALTGHLVLSTLHTNNASGVIPRLIDMGIEPFLIASSLNLVIAQRLIRRLCPAGKTEEKVPEPLNSKIARIINNIPKNSGLDIPKPPYHFYKGVENEQCYQGYSGRIAVFEAIEINEEIQSLITQNVKSSDLEKAARKYGFASMFEDALIKSSKGITSLEEALRVSIMGSELKEQF